MERRRQKSLGAKPLESLVNSNILSNNSDDSADIERDKNERK